MDTSSHISSRFYMHKQQPTPGKGGVSRNKREIHVGIGFMGNTAKITEGKGAGGKRRKERLPSVTTVKSPNATLK